MLKDKLNRTVKNSKQISITKEIVLTGLAADWNMYGLIQLNLSTGSVTACKVH